MTALLGLVALHLMGAGLGGLAMRGGWGAALRSPSSAWLGLAAAWCASLGLAGLGLGALLVAAVVLGRPQAPARLTRGAWAALAALALLVLARPWAPTMWDELVWLGKSRLESLGFGEGVRAALDPSQRLVPPGYPPLWPAAVGWLSLGQDELPAQTVAAALLVVLATAAAMEAWEASGWELAVGLLAAPLVLVHVRSIYVDLPVGLLALALLGHLVRQGAGLAPVAVALAAVLPALKDEGLAHALAATAAAGVVGRGRAGAWRLWLPGVVALASTGVWRWLAWAHGVENVDHSLVSPLWSWAPTLGRLLVLHAADVWTWGVFWPVVLAVAVASCAGPEDRAVRGFLVAALGLLGLALLTGPERVRVFAENGTLVNRMLVQLWPAAAVLVWRGLKAPPIDGVRPPDERP